MECLVYISLLTSLFLSFSLILWGDFYLSVFTCLPVSTFDTGGGGGGGGGSGGGGRGGGGGGECVLLDGVEMVSDFEHSTTTVDERSGRRPPQVALIRNAD